MRSILAEKHDFIVIVQRCETSSRSVNAILRAFDQFETMNPHLVDKFSISIDVDNELDFVDICRLVNFISSRQASDKDVNISFRHKAKSQWKSIRLIIFLKVCFDCKVRMKYNEGSWDCPECRYSIC